MQDASVISTYVDLLASKLNFHPSLARRVRREVEDHLCEAAARSGNRRDSEERAVASFGDPHLIATQFAVAWLADEARKVGLAVIVIIAGVFVAMKARIAWYGAAQWGLSEEVRTLARVVGVIDACAFWLSVIVAMIGLAHLFLHRAAPAALHAAHYRQLRRVLLVSTLSTAALVVSVTGDATLTGLRLIGRELPAGFLIPICSMIIEIGCTGLLIFKVRTVVGRMAHAAALLKT